jgi:hypothetical protein
MELISVFLSLISGRRHALKGGRRGWMRLNGPGLLLSLYYTLNPLNTTEMILFSEENGAVGR